MVDGESVIARYADENKLSAISCHFCRELDRLIRPRCLECDINTSAKRLNHQLLPCIRPGRIDGNAAKLFCQVQSPGKLFDHEDRIHFRLLCRLKNKQTYRSRADDHRGFAGLHFGEINRMQGDPERFEKCARLGIKRIRKWKTSFRRNDNALTEASTVGKQTAEMKGRLIAV